MLGIGNSYTVLEKMSVLLNYCQEQMERLSKLEVAWAQGPSHAIFGINCREAFIHGTVDICNKEKQK